MCQGERREYQYTDRVTTVYRFHRCSQYVEGEHPCGNGYIQDCGVEVIPHRCPQEPTPSNSTRSSHRTASNTHFSSGASPRGHSTSGRQYWHGHHSHRSDVTGHEPSIPAQTSSRQQTDTVERIEDTHRSSRPRPPESRSSGAERAQPRHRSSRVVQEQTPVRNSRDRQPVPSRAAATQGDRPRSSHQTPPVVIPHQHYPGDSYTPLSPPSTASRSSVPYVTEERLSPWDRQSHAASRRPFVHNPASSNSSDDTIRQSATAQTTRVQTTPTPRTTASVAGFESVGQTDAEMAREYIARSVERTRVDARRTSTRQDQGRRQQTAERRPPPPNLSALRSQDAAPANYHPTAGISRRAPGRLDINLAQPGATSSRQLTPPSPQPNVPNHRSILRTAFGSGVPGESAAPSPLPSPATTPRSATVEDAGDRYPHRPCTKHVTFEHTIDQIKPRREGGM